MNCQRPDRDVPGIICGYPLPCPFHTVVIDESGVVPTVTIPVTQVPRIKPKTLKRLKTIAKALHKDDKKK